MWPWRTKAQQLPVRKTRTIPSWYNQLLDNDITYSFLRSKVTVLAAIVTLAIFYISTIRALDRTIQSI